jgi:tocopherol O-methyltransferase
MKMQIDELGAVVEDTIRNGDRVAKLGFGKSEIRRHYDVMSLWYRLFWGEHLHHGWFTNGEESPKKAQVEMLRRCASMVGIRHGTRVLDVGCGYGGTSFYLASEFGCQVDGLSLSPRQLRIAERKAQSAGLDILVNFHLQDAETFNYPVNRYAFAWTMESSEHFVNKLEYFRRVRNTLRSDGRLLLAAWTGSMGHSRVRDVAQHFVCPQLCTAEEYLDFIQASGMQVDEVVDATSFVVPTWQICLRRIERLRRFKMFFPKEACSFAEGIAVILDAYLSGELTYTVLTARR